MAFGIPMPNLPGLEDAIFISLAQQLVVIQLPSNRSSLSCFPVSGGFRTGGAAFFTSTFFFSLNLTPCFPVHHSFRLLGHRDVPVFFSLKRGNATPLFPDCHLVGNEVFPFLAFFFGSGDLT